MADPIQLPQSGGGLIRYSEEVPSKFTLSPGVVVGLIVAVILLEILLHARFFGVLS